ncbi:MAG: hypothetical protein HEEMFOPI_00801 [Holosporales bacterium]
MNQILSEERINSLKIELDPPVFRQLIGIYTSELQSLMFYLEDQLARKKSEDCTKTAHSIKGISANMGAVGIKEIAADIEQLAKTSDFAAISQKLPSFKGAIAQTLAEFNKFL